MKCISWNVNGLRACMGKGFADFVKMYGGNPVLYTVDYLEAVDVDALADFLKKDQPSAGQLHRYSFDMRA